MTTENTKTPYSWPGNCKKSALNPSIETPTQPPKLRQTTTKKSQNSLKQNILLP